MRSVCIPSLAILASLPLLAPPKENTTPSKGVNGHGAGNRFCDHIIDNRSIRKPSLKRLASKTLQASSLELGFVASPPLWLQSGEHVRESL